MHGCNVIMARLLHGCGVIFIWVWHDNSSQFFAKIVVWLIQGGMVVAKLLQGYNDHYDHYNVVMWL